MLQGTFETLSLDEVLELLAATRKTGGLHLTAGRDAGAVWVEDGACCAVEHGSARGPVVDDVGLLARVVRLGAAIARHRDGAFRFVPREEPPWRAGQPASLVEALGEIERQVARWEEVRKVVPSLDVRARLSDQLGVEQLLVDRDRWRTIAAVAAGRTVRELAEGGGDELAVCQTVALLVEAGAVTLEQDVLARPTGRGTLAESPYGPGVDDLAAARVVELASRSE